MHWAFCEGNNFRSGKVTRAVCLSCPKVSRKAGGDILEGLSFMKTAFSQNGRRNIAVVVDLLSFSETRVCAIAISTVHREKWALFNGEHGKSELEYLEILRVFRCLAYFATFNNLNQLTYFHSFNPFFNFEKIRFWKMRIYSNFSDVY